MAEKIIPFARTVLLPAGSPAIGRVDGVRMDVSALRCHFTGEVCCCSGDADVLIEYCSAPPDSGSLFGGPQPRGRAWQALLSLPVELAWSSGGDWAPVPPGDYQPELGHLEWFMVASNAVELEGSLVVAWEEPALAEDAPLPAQPEPEPLPPVDGAADAAPAPEAPTAPAEEKEQDEAARAELGLIWRPENRTNRTKGNQHATRGWTMVNVEAQQPLQTDPAVEEQIQQLAAAAEQTAAEANRLWQELDQRGEAAEAATKTEQEEISQAQEDTGEDLPGPAEEEGEPPEPAADQPPAVSLPEEHLRQAIFEALSSPGQPSLDQEEDQEDEDLREGVVVRMRFGLPPEPAGKRLYYPGPDQAEEAPPQTLAEVLAEALGEEFPQPRARLRFGWEPEDPTPEPDLTGEAGGELSPLAAEVEDNAAQPEAYEDEPETPMAVQMEESQPGPVEAGEDVQPGAQGGAASPPEPGLPLAEQETPPAPLAQQEQGAGENAPDREPAGPKVRVGTQPAPEKQEGEAPASPGPDPAREKDVLAPVSPGPVSGPEEAIQPATVAEDIPAAQPPEAEASAPAAPIPGSGGRERAAAPPASSREQVDPPLPAAPAAPVATPEQIPIEPPRVEADPIAMEEALDAALEPEVLPPGGKKARKRRAVGLPRLHIDARDNNVEISAFNLQIKL